MSRTIQSYFSTKSHAEAVKSSLAAYETESLEIGELANPYDEDEAVAVIVPIPGTATSTASGVSGSPAGTPGMTTGVLGANISGNHAESIPGTGKNLQGMRYVLSVKVKEEDYNEVVNIIYRNMGKIA